MKNSGDRYFLTSLVWWSRARLRADATVTRADPTARGFSRPRRHNDSSLHGPLRFPESRSNSISCTPIVSQKELQRLTCLYGSSSPLSRFAKKLDRPPSADAAQRHRFARNAGGSQTAPSSPETHKEEEAAAAAAETSDASAAPAAPPPVKSNPVLVHVADYASSDCVSDSVDSDGRRSPAVVRDVDGDKSFSGPFFEDDSPGTRSAASAGVRVSASKSDGQIYTRRCEALDASTTSLNRQTQCCMSFKPHPKTSRKKSQSHSCRLV